MNIDWEADLVARIQRDIEINGLRAYDAELDLLLSLAQVLNGKFSFTHTCGFSKSFCDKYAIEIAKRIKSENPELWENFVNQQNVCRVSSAILPHLSKIHRLCEEAAQNIPQKLTAILESLSQSEGVPDGTSCIADRLFDIVINTFSIWAAETETKTRLKLTQADRPLVVALHGIALSALKRGDISTVQRHRIIEMLHCLEQLPVTMPGMKFRLTLCSRLRYLPDGLNDTGDQSLYWVDRTIDLTTHSLALELRNDGLQDYRLYHVDGTNPGTTCYYPKGADFRKNLLIWAELFAAHVARPKHELEIVGGAQIEWDNRPDSVPWSNF